MNYQFVDVNYKGLVTIPTSLVCPGLVQCVSWLTLQQQKHPSGWICDHTGKDSREKLLKDGSLYPIKVWKPPSQC